MDKSPSGCFLNHHVLLIVLLLLILLLLLLGTRGQSPTKAGENETCERYKKVLFLTHRSKVLECSGPTHMWMHLVSMPSRVD